jgi:hypothetical protein
VQSTLELRIGGVPFPHGDGRGWHYRHAVRPEGVSDCDRQAVSDFLDYEARCERQVSVVADPELADWARWGRPDRRPVPGTAPTQCCTHVYPDGCGQTGLLCHGTPVGMVERILADGCLRSSVSLSGRDAHALASASSWGEPPDYFNYVMLANGRCTAPEAVALSRQLGRDLVPADLAAGYPPAARFYFAWDQVVGLDGAAFDGVHPIKVNDQLELFDNLLLLVLPDTGDPIDIPPAYAERVMRLTLDAPSPQEWASESAKVVGTPL